MNTGDIILYKMADRPTKWWLLDKVITTFTHSPWVHVGIILKDQTWLGLQGTYLLESAWTNIPDVTDGKKKFGVQIVPFYERIKPGETYYRQYTGDPIDTKSLEIAYNFTKNKSYDVYPYDWVEAYLGTDTDPQKSNRFWCSALVACILTKIGILEEHTDWSIVTPEFFGDEVVPSYGPVKFLKNLEL